MVGEIVEKEHDVHKQLQADNIYRPIYALSTRTFP